jgi:hypothetical protein
MKVVISSGHGKHIRGASGYIDEVDEARKVVNRVTDILNGMGVQTIKFHDDVSTTQSQNLDRIVDFHNAQTRDWDVSVHFNAFETTSKPMGTEVLYLSNAGQTKANAVVDAICEAASFTNRGPKHRTDLAFLNNTEAPAILIETCFVDSRADVDIYNAQFENICEAIAESVSGEEVEEGPVRPRPPRGDEEEIMDIAIHSAIADYQWKDRGRAPAGYIKGFALAWAQVVKRFALEDTVVMEMAKPNTGSSTDVLQVYNSDFVAKGMTNEYGDIHTLRHLFALLLGLGMRESSGKHCEGRDTTATNVTSDTAEAGLYQTSYNAHSFCDEFDIVMDEYEEGTHEGYVEVFKEGVSCSEADWASYGSGRGRQFQDLCKTQPAFAVETCALVLRNRCDHYGPINRKEAELRSEADWMLLDVQRYVENSGEA